MNAMNTIQKTGFAALLLCAAQGAAAIQDVPLCSTGDLSLQAGRIFQASCSGDLRVEVSSVIEAEESITLLAGGHLWMAGTLTAPVITLMAQAALNLSPESLVLAGGSVVVAGSADSVGRIEGNLTRLEGLSHPGLVPISGGRITLVSAAVPEPSHLALFGAGLGLIAWKRRAARALSRTAHAPRNPNFTLEK